MRNPYICGTPWQKYYCRLNYWIEKVNAARRQAEEDKPSRGKHQVADVEEIAREDEGGIEKEVLNPLLQPHRGDDVAERSFQGQKTAGSS